MPRKPRFAPPGYWLHITQRGNNQQPVFTTDADHQYFLSLLDTRSEERHVRIASYSLMWNHFHLVAAGDRPEAISRFMMDVNGQYAIYRHGLKRQSGHLWQGRFYSCVLDDAHWETALRYVEANPVRAGVAKLAGDYRWSSATAHLGLAPIPSWLDTEQFQRRWPTAVAWADRLATLTRREAAQVRQATRHEGALRFRRVRQAARTDFWSSTPPQTPGHPPTPSLKIRRQRQSPVALPED